MTAVPHNDTPSYANARVSAFVAQLYPISPEFLTALSYAHLDPVFGDVLNLIAHGRTEALPTPAFSINALATCSITSVAEQPTIFNSTLLPLQEFIESGVLTAYTARAGERTLFTIMRGTAQNENSIALSNIIIDRLKSDGDSRFELPSPIEAPTPTGSGSGTLRPVVDTLRALTQKHSKRGHICVRTNEPAAAYHFITETLISEGFLVERSAPWTRSPISSLIAANIPDAQNSQNRIIIQTDADGPFSSQSQQSVAENEVDLDDDDDPQADKSLRRKEPPLTSAQQSFIRLAGSFKVPVVHIIDGHTPVHSNLSDIVGLVCDLNFDKQALTASAIRSIASECSAEITDASAARIASLTDAPWSLRETINLSAMTGSSQDIEDNCVKHLIAFRNVKPLPPPDNFDIRYVHASTGAETFVRRLVGKKDQPLSILLHGAPGTSKTSFARHIAKELGMHVHLATMAELVCYRYGASERAIQRAFRTAATNGQFLIIDEVEGILMSRQNATRSFELTIVNQMLTEMEAHNLPYAFTTNHIHLLDTAAVRRLRYKVEMLPLDTDRFKIAWQEMLGFQLHDLPWNPDIEEITISDVATALHHIDDLPIRSPVEALRLIQSERNARKGVKSA